MAGKVLTREEENKLIERTCKYDAYQAVYMWVKGGANDFTPTHGDAAWYAYEKMLGHYEFLKNHTHRYAFVDGIVENDGYYDKEKP